MRPTTGTALGGRYRLDRPIAVGGMGEVWVAHDLSLRRDVAVKVLREEFAGDAGFLERFRTEARNAASLTHPNIAATHDYGEQQGSSYLVMELVPGEPLSDLLEREPVLPERRLLPILAQTARALHAAHLAGVVHRDVKPGNILLGPGGRVKITDFGVSTTPDQAPMTATGMVMGTAQYLSPEQAVGRPATAASDLYSLGVVAYEALAGRRPFTGPTAVDIAVAHVNDRVPPLPAAVSAPVSALVLRLLAKDPADRPPSAGAVARALDAMVGHTPPDGVPVDEPGAAGPGAARTRPPLGAAPASIPPVTPPPPVTQPPPVTAPPPVTPPPPVRTPPAAAAPAPPRPAGGSRPGTPPSYPPRHRVPDPRAGGRPAPGSPAPADPRAGAPRPAPSTVGPAPRATTAVADGRRPHRDGAGDPARRPEPPARTSTTTGRRLGRFGRWSWPLVALVALLLALLVAALTDSVGGAQGTAALVLMALSPLPTAPGHRPSRPGPTLGHGPVRRTDDGMITACAPSGHPGDAVTTTLKDA